MKFKKLFIVCVFIILTSLINVKTVYAEETNVYELTERQWFQFPEVVNDPNLTMFLTEVSDIIEPGTYSLDIKIGNINGDGQYSIDFYGDDYDPASAEVSFQLSPQLSEFEKKIEVEITDSLPSNIYLRLFTRDNCSVELKSLKLRKNDSVSKKILDFFDRSNIKKMTWNNLFRKIQKSQIINCISSDFWHVHKGVASNNTDGLLIKAGPRSSVWAKSKLLQLPQNQNYLFEIIFSECVKVKKIPLITIDFFKPNAWNDIEHNCNIYSSKGIGVLQTNKFWLNTKNIPTNFYIRIMGGETRPILIHKFSYKHFPVIQYYLVKLFKYIWIPLISIIVGIFVLILLKHKKVLWGIFPVLLIICLVLGSGANGRFLSIEVILQFAVAFLFNLISGWWLAYFVLPKKWKFFTLPLALPLGHIVSTSILMVLCSLIGLPFSITLYSFITISLIVDIICFCFVKKKRSLINRELWFPFVAAAIVFACLLFPAKNQPVHGLYSNCIDGLLYSTFSEYIENPVEAKQNWNSSSYNYGKSFSKEGNRGYKDNREGSAYGLASFSKLLNKKPYECIRFLVIFIYILLPLTVYLIIRLIFKLNIGVAFLSSLFAGICPVLAYSAQNNSLSQVQGQLGFLLAILFLCQLFKNKIWKDKIFWFLLIGFAISCFFVMITYFLVLKLYIFIFILGIIIGLICYKFKSIKWVALISVLLILSFYGAYRSRLMKPEILPVKIQNVIESKPKATGDIRIMLNPFYVCGMLDIVKPSGRHTNITFPVISKNFIYILAAIGLGFMFVGFLNFDRKLKFIVLFICIGLLFGDIILRYHYQWAYAIKKHLGMCVPVVALLWGTGVAVLFSKSKNKFLRFLTVITSTLILLISGFAVIQTGNYWLQKRYYFDSKTLSLMKNIEYHVPKNAKIFVKNVRIEKYLYLLRDWKNMSFHNPNSEFAVIDNRTIEASPKAWFADSNQHILLFETETEKLVKKK